MKAPFLFSSTEKHYKQGGKDFKSDQHFFGPFLEYENILPIYRKFFFFGQEPVVIT